MSPRPSLPPWRFISPQVPSLVRDLGIVVTAIALLYGVLSLIHAWAAPVNAQQIIDLSPRALPRYALFSLARITVAYVLSLVFAIGYSYVAAHNRVAERLMIPLLDALQSIPVLSFLPGVMLAMVALVPTRQLGLELGSILLIFTGQVWNMAFSAYSSTRTIPRDLLEAAEAYRLGRWQTFAQLELPFAAIGLVWNSMMSVAGAWFFLMACEMFVLGRRDLRLPGLGSYLQTAADAGNVRAIVWGLAVMVVVITLVDQLCWRPLIAWSQKFKFEQVESSEAVSSPVLELLRRSRILAYVSGRVVAPVVEAVALRIAQRAATTSSPSPAVARARKWTSRASIAAGAGISVYALTELALSISSLTKPQTVALFRSAGATFLRVESSLLISALWTVPVGVFIGLRPRLAAIVQPAAQVAASVPATAVFPIIVLFLIALGGGLGVASMLLLVLSTQWYILFNVIAGASAIPSDLREVCAVYRLAVVERWRRLVLPAIFPYLITGLVTASGGAWNASIVAEYFRFRGQTMSTLGLGATISRATDEGNFAVLIGATVLMAAIVVTINRVVWRRLYALASTRFVLD